MPAEPVEGPTTRPTQTWRAAFADSLRGPLDIAVVDDVVVVAGADAGSPRPRNAGSEVWSFDAQSGELRWRAHGTPKGNRSLFATVGSSLVVRAYADRTQRHSLDGLDVRDGSLQWSVEYPTWEHMLLLGVGDDVFWTSSSRSVSARDIDGNERWRFEVADDDRMVSAQRCSDIVCMSSADGTLLALDAATGEQRWQQWYGWPDQHSRAGVVAEHDDVLLLSITRWSGDDRREHVDRRSSLMLMERETGAIRRVIVDEMPFSWQYLATCDGAFVMSAARYAPFETQAGIVVFDAVSGDELHSDDSLLPTGFSHKMLLSSSGTGPLWGVDVRTGDRRWAVDRWLMRVAGGDTLLYAVDHKSRELVAIAPETGREEWAVPCVPPDEWARELIVGSGFVVVQADTVVTTLVE